MRNLSFLAFTVSLVLPAASAGQDKKAAPSIVPQLERCIMTVAGKGFKPRRASELPANYRLAGARRIYVEDDQVRAVGMETEKPLWTAKAPKGIALGWLSADTTFAYFAGAKSINETFEPEVPLKIHRLDLKTGTWAAALPVEMGALPAEAPVKAKGKDSIAYLLSSRGWVVVLTNTQYVTDDHEWNDQLASYRVTAFKAGQTKPAWSKTFTAVGKWYGPGVYLWAARSPENFTPDVTALNWVDDDVLVCAGSGETVHCLRGSSGEALWKSERIWENQRGFIGPSVWSHFIAPHGERERPKKHGGKKDGETKEADKKAGTALVQYNVGGPVVVQQPGAEPDEMASPRIFVAVAKGPPHYTTYLAECTVYQLSSRGQIMAMTNVPRVVRGSRGQTLDGSFVWVCGGGALLKINAAANAGRIFDGPGGPDCLCDIDWYRQYPPKKVNAWLASDPAGDPIAFAPEHGFRVRTGGYVATEAEPIYRFPIAMIDLRTGNETPLLLSVPFEGKLPAPETNYSRTESPDGKKQYHTSGPYHLGITVLRVVGDRLHVTLGMEAWHRTLEFDWKPWVRRD